MKGNNPRAPHTAPTHEFPSMIPDEFSIFPKNKSAPGVLGILNDPSEKFSCPPITPATNRLNQKLSKLLKLLGTSGSISGQKLRGDTEQEQDDRERLVAQFDKNWYEIMHLIEYAKKMNEGESGKESMLNLANYGSEMKSKHHKVAQNTLADHSEKHRPGAVTVVGRLAPLPGRKPMRTIIADLQRRLNDIRTNTSEWEALQRRVELYEGTDEADVDNFMLKNKKAMANLVPDIKKLEEKKRNEKMRQREQAVLETKRKLDKAALDAKLRHIKEKEKRLAKNLAQEKDLVGNISVVQAKWFSVIFVAVRVKKLQQLLEKKHAERVKHLQMHHAARILQRWYKSFLNAKMELAKKNALVVIAYHFKKYLAKWRMDRLRKASFTVQLFFKEVYDVSKLLKVVKKYRFAVIKAQQYIRGFVLIRNSRVLAISKFWDSVEDKWWTQRQKTAGNAESGTAERKDKSADKNKKKKAEKAGNQRIAADLKNKYILENLIERRKIFWKAWYAEYKAASENVGGPATSKVPLFQLLPSMVELYDMMDKAYSESRGLK